jgi:hypothetical protein
MNLAIIDKYQESGKPIVNDLPSVSIDNTAMNPGTRP